MYVATVSTFNLRQNFTNFTNYGDSHENKIIKFPQLQCLVGTFRSNLVNFVKIKQTS